MQTNQILRKGLGVGIILLLIGVATVPSINAHNDMIFPKVISNPEKEVSMTVLEYRADGTTRRSVVNLPQGQVENLRRELRTIKDTNAQLSIYKKYHLISSDVTDESLQEGMKNKARNMGLQADRIRSYITQVYSDNPNANHTCMNFHCQVDGVCEFGFRILGGLSFLTSVPNGYLYRFHLYNLFLPSIDLFQVNFGYLGIFHLYNGTYPDRTITGIIHGSLLIGFVGYYISATPTFFFTTVALYHGYAVAAFGFIGAPTTEV
jgi:hypothetical protein